MKSSPKYKRGALWLPLTEVESALLPPLICLHCERQAHNVSVALCSGHLTDNSHRRSREAQKLILSKTRFWTDSEKAFLLTWIEITPASTLGRYLNRTAKQVIGYASHFGYPAPLSGLKNIKTLMEETGYMRVQIQRAMARLGLGTSIVSRQGNGVALKHKSRVSFIKKKVYQGRNTGMVWCITEAEELAILHFLKYEHLLPDTRDLTCMRCLATYQRQRASPNKLCKPCQVRIAHNFRYGRPQLLPLGRLTLKSYHAIRSVQALTTDGVKVAEAARLLGLTYDRAYDRSRFRLPTQISVQTISAALAAYEAKPTPLVNWDDLYDEVVQGFSTGNFTGTTDFQKGRSK